MPLVGGFDHDVAEATMNRSLAIAFAGLLCFVSITSSAQEPEASSDADTAEARYRFRQGVVAYDTGHFADAVGHFEAALELSGRPVMYYNLYLAHRDNADLAGAIDALEHYLQSGVTAESAPQGERLQSLLNAMRERVANEGTVHSSDELIDPEAEPMPTEPEPAEEVPPPSTRGRTIAAVSLLGVAAGGLALGIAMQVKRGNEADRIDEECTLGPSGDFCPASLDQQSISDRYSRFGAVRWVGFGLAGAALAAGITLLVLPSGDGGSSTQAGLACDGSGCTAALRGEF